MIKNDVIIAGVKCKVESTTYQSGGLALAASCLNEGGEGYAGYEEPFAVLTVNLVGQTIDKDEAFLDTNNLPSIETDLRAAGLIGDKPIRLGVSGWCTYPLYKINL